MVKFEENERPDFLNLETILDNLINNSVQNENEEPVTINKENLSKYIFIKNK
jgi:hypothetical protein